MARLPRLLNVVEDQYSPKLNDALRTPAFGCEFRNPLGLAAGLDKDGAAIDFWSALGFGFVELGTVTPKNGQPGNDKPRLERIRENDAIVNRMGFNNLGAPQLAERLRARRTAIPVGANIGKAKLTPNENAADDYEETLSAVFTHASYVVLNVSSPNTPGLRDLQSIAVLESLLDRVVLRNQRLAMEQQTAPRPILLKIAPDLADGDIDAIADLARAKKLAGIVATNTTLRHELAARKPKIQGGLSGPPLRARAHELVRRLFRRLEGAMPIVGVGGIRSAEDAYLRIRAGASLVQVYTGLIYEGPGLVRAIVEGLGAHLEKDGYDSIQRVVGIDA